MDRDTAAQVWERWVGEQTPAEFAALSDALWGYSIEQAVANYLAERGDVPDREVVAEALVYYLETDEAIMQAQACMEGLDGMQCPDGGLTHYGMSVLGEFMRRLQSCGTAEHVSDAWDAACEWAH